MQGVDADSPAGRRWPSPYGLEVPAVVLQVGFAVLLVLDMWVSGWAQSAPATWQAASASLLAGVVTLAVVAIPWRLLPHLALAVPPALDLAALGVARIGEPATGADVLCVLPALWLAREFGHRGALAAGALAVLTMSVPWLLVLGPVEGNISGAVLVPLVATVVGLVLAWSNDEARHRHDQLRVALAAQERLRRFNAAILDTVDVGLVLLDHEGRYQAMNRRHRDFMRLAFPDGHHGVAGELGEVFGPDGTSRVARVDMPSTRASRGEEFDDARIWCGDDPLTRRALSVSARTVRDEDGQLTGAALAYKDVTDLMRALAVKDEFVASVSHELRTPLTSIVGFTQLLLDESDDADLQERHLGIVARNAERLDRLVADLLQTARLDQGALRLARSEVDLAQVVRDCLRSAAATAESASVALEDALPPRLLARVDGQRVAQVVDNLVSNAIKYTPGGGRVRVGLARVGDAVELRVADTGIGIEPADRDRLFLRFFRASSAEERSIQGVGLGLSITKAIVEAHGGRIEVDSDPGVGSTFTVRLPGAAPAQR